eukprot:Blabericola_migrator_1__6989@NODE_3541_length_1691_cov_202_015394_g2197_i0_p1_GENE_NODE_3541_length_1691_cov_202_015394_g2197_i0NODE_3541_length_1691_cov_202_015394_g2197_i0_p1_ORF_typecomplete_len335_score49_28Kelch_6/PF13964_6/0_47Kelch_6/PF13964_6/8_1e06Kelch_6/PF13964_6/3_5e05Kelch_6/PF13964_6/4_6e06Kelch_6/PF13964_6/0_076Kelch_5/PF13854_6/0_00015Kelch_5/PF13854_6/4_7e06Kelch_5/PF13854_6/9e05Kelch_5/PF13854_6/0_00032Kelch_2/PF07646_15/16Kelch_2/PF07646_15/1e05Kelch_2/PF07646_15/8_4e05Kelch_2
MASYYDIVTDGDTIVSYSNSKAGPNVLRRFDLETQKWKWIPTAGPFPPCRLGFKMAVCQGLLVVFGGCTEGSDPEEYSNDIHVYRLNHWRRLPAIDDGPTPRYETTMITMENKIYVIGGFSAEDTHRDIWTLDMTNVVENPQSGIPTWELLTTSGPQRLCAAAVAHNNKLYIFGGMLLGWHNGALCFNDTKIFDLQLREWYWLDPPGSRNTLTRRLAYHYSPDGDLEEFEMQQIEVNPLNTKEALPEFVPIDFRTLDDSEWKVTPKDLSMPLPRTGAKAAVQDGWLYMMGGELWSCDPHNTIYLDDCWKLELGRSMAYWELVRPGTYWKALVSY